MTRQKGWQRENMRHWHREEKRTDFPGCRKIVLANYARDKSVERGTAQDNPEGESSKKKEFERNAIKTNGRTCGASKSFGLRQVFFYRNDRGGSFSSSSAFWHVENNSRLLLCILFCFVIDRDDSLCTYKRSKSPLNSKIYEETLIHFSHTKNYNQC